ncbi:MAG TPA: GNAT family N-acetyltransferase [Saprospiraceae bacterium]|nr:GNAT family N-acetyltransferase [Saprospiraceae bacterium]
MQIRKVNKSDNESLASVIRNVFDEYDAPKHGTVFSDPTTDHLYELFEVDKSVLWVAALDGNIVGCCGIYPTEGLPNKCVELVKFYLQADARGKGIGRMLMEKSLESAREFGYIEVYLESLPHFSKAISMYEKQGFLKLDKAMGKSGHTSCNVWMIKNIK